MGRTGVVRLFASFSVLSGCNFIPFLYPLMGTPDVLCIPPSPSASSFPSSLFGIRLGENRSSLHRHHFVATPWYRRPVDGLWKTTTCWHLFLQPFPVSRLFGGAPALSLPTYSTLKSPGQHIVVKQSILSTFLSPAFSTFSFWGVAAVCCQRWLLTSPS